MKSDTQQYIHLQNLYKRQAESEKTKFVEILTRVGSGFGEGAETVTEAAVTLADDFVKNSHALKLLRGKCWGSAINPNDFSEQRWLLQTNPIAHIHLLRRRCRFVTLTGCHASGSISLVCLPSLERSVPCSWGRNG